MNHPISRDSEITLTEMSNLDTRVKLFEKHLDEMLCEDKKRAWAVPLPNNE